MTDGPAIGAWAERTLVVTEEHTATRWGSGEMPVLATPQLIALMEGAALDAVRAALPAGYQTVGGAIAMRHLAATPVGGVVCARAELVAVGRRKLTFRVEASDRGGQIGEGTHERYVVAVERFLERARQRGA